MSLIRTVSYFAPLRPPVPASAASGPRAGAPWTTSAAARQHAYAEHDAPSPARQRAHPSIDVAFRGRPGWFGAARVVHCAPHRLPFVGVAHAKVPRFDASAPLRSAARNGNVDEARRLLPGITDVNAKDGRGRTALHYAAAAGHTDMLDLLLLAGADPEQVDIRGCTALHTCCKHNHLSAALILCANRPSSKLDLYDHTGATALHLAVKAKSMGCVTALIHCGASAELADWMQRTPLHSAIAAGHEGLVEILLKAGVATLHADVYGTTPLDLAIDSCREDLCLRLLDAGARLHARPALRYDAALDRLVSEGRVSFLRMLLRGQPDRRARRNLAINILWMVMLEGKAELVAPLLRAAGGLRAQNLRWLSREAARLGREHMSDQLFDAARPRVRRAWRHFAGWCTARWGIRHARHATQYRGGFVGCRDEHGSNQKSERA